MDTFERNRRVRIRAPGRLHFGLISLGAPAEPPASGDEHSLRQFGGVGVMVDSPAWQLTIEASNQWSVSGCEVHQVEVDRLEKLARRWTENVMPSGDFAPVGQAGLPDCRIVIDEVLPQHAGLGSGTQLAVALLRGLTEYAGFGPTGLLDLAIIGKRGRRSAVGLYGSLYGGLIVDGGKIHDEPVASLDCRVDVPAAWRFVIFLPESDPGLSGDHELTAFGKLPLVNAAASHRLRQEIRDVMVPAVVAKDFEQFASSVGRYNEWAGELYATVQDGPFNGAVVTELIHRLRREGFRGVGQSSWGPAVFVAVPDERTARQLCNDAGRFLRDDRSRCWIASPCNHGLQIKTSNEVLVSATSKIPLRRNGACPS